MVYMGMEFYTIVVVDARSIDMMRIVEQEYNSTLAS